MPQRLGNEHTVEWVTVGTRQSAGACGVIHRNGKSFETLICDGSCNVGGNQVRRPGSLPSRCLVVISQADAALMSTSLSSSAIARLAA